MVPLGFVLQQWLPMLLFISLLNIHNFLIFWCFISLKKRHPASKTLRRSSNPPFLRSITLWNNPRYRTLWLTRFANLATLFRRNSLIQTEKCSLFREKKCPQSFLNVQIIISHAIRYFCKKKFWFHFNRAQSWNDHEMFTVFCCLP